MTKTKLPIALTFNDNYVIPAGVAMYSLMENANPDYFYEFNIIHHGLSIRNQKKLIKNLEQFHNQSIKFIYADTSFSEIFAQLPHPSHFSPEIFYKLQLPSLLKDYDKIIVSDVDVLFLGDISPAYTNFTGNHYIAAIRHYSKDVIIDINNIYRDFPEDYKQRINNFGAGFMIFNLKKMRQDNIEQKMLDFLKKNIDKLIYPEQEVLNYICSPQTEYIDLKYMSVPFWIKEDTLDAETIKNYYSPYTLEQVKTALEHPVQLHYATSAKPWKTGPCYDRDLWLKMLCKTVFVTDFFNNLNLLYKEDYLKIFNRNKIAFRYWRYKLLSKFTFGNMGKKYKQKKKDMKGRLKEIRNFLRN